MIWASFCAIHFITNIPRFICTGSGHTIQFLKMQCDISTRSEIQKMGIWRPDKHSKIQKLNQLCSQKCKGGFGWMFGVETCRWPKTFSGRAPPPCENILYQQDTQSAFYLGFPCFPKARESHRFKRIDLCAAVFVPNLSLINHYLK